MSSYKPNSIEIQEPFSWHDMHSIKLIIQFFFSFCILGVCSFQLLRTDIPEKDKNDALYWSCITGILSLWMPSPASAKSFDGSGGVGDDASPSNLTTLPQSMPDQSSIAIAHHPKAS